MNNDSLIETQLDKWFTSISFITIAINGFVFTDTMGHLYHYNIKEERILHQDIAYHELVKLSPLTEGQFRSLLKEFLNRKLKLKIKTLW